MRTHQKQYGERSVRHLVYHQVEESWYRKLSQICHSARAYVLMLMLRAIFVCPWKMVSVSVRYLFYQPMVEKNKTWTLRFPAKENPNMEKGLFDWPIVLQYDVKAISRKFFRHEVFSAERSLNQPKARCVCIRSINQSNRYFRSLVVSVLFARFHFKVIRKSLYALVKTRLWPNFDLKLSNSFGDRHLTL